MKFETKKVWIERIVGGFSIGFYDITPYIVSDIVGSTGIQGWGMRDRIASTGLMRFTLWSKNNLFTPGHDNCLTGFAKNIPVYLNLGYEGRAKKRWYGYIDKLDVRALSSGNFVQVTAVDFMDKFAKHEMSLPSYAEDKTLDEIVALIVANMPVSPKHTDYCIGTSKFASVFDSAVKKTTALQELAKVVISELGYVYLTQGANGETLRSEGRYTRSDKSVDGITSTTAFMMTEDDDEIETEGYVSGGYVVSPEDIIFEGVEAKVLNSMMSTEPAFGDNYCNAVKTIVYPRTVDASVVVLFTLDKVIAINAGETQTITGRYTDPDDNSTSVGGTDMVTPVATTDYLMNTAEDGSGLNITADLDITATYGATKVEYVLKNTNANTGYVTFLQARGKGIYNYNPIEYEVEDTSAIAVEGKMLMLLDMPYQDDPTVGEGFAQFALDRYGQPRLSYNRITLNANRSETELVLFQEIQVGDKIRLRDDWLETNKDYFVHSIDFVVDRFGAINYGLGLCNASLAISAAYWELGTDGKTELGLTTVLAL